MHDPSPRIQIPLVAFALLFLIAPCTHGATSPVAFAAGKLIGTVTKPSRVWTADLDGDGDLDVLGTSSHSDRLIWWENTGGDASNRVEHPITTSLEGTYGMDVVDLDGDGDRDILAAFGHVDELVWWANRGGRFSFETTAAATHTIAPGSRAAAMRVTLLPRGRPGDDDEELASLDLVFERNDRVPLSASEAHAVTRSLSVWRDDGSGVLESATASTLHQFLITHLVDSASAAEDREYD